MAGWTQHAGPVATLAIENMDTDQLIPARFMSAPRSAGYGGFLLHDLRFDAEGAALAGAPLNGHTAPSILIAGRNFGCGSSREAAVYALVDFGIRAVIAPSFGDIFAANAVNNGLLPAQVTEEVATRLLTAPPAEIAIDLTARTLTASDTQIPFAVDPTWQLKLINGWDDIDLTASLTDKIAAHRKRDRVARPWATMET